MIGQYYCYYLFIFQVDVVFSQVWPCLLWLARLLALGERVWVGC